MKKGVAKLKKCIKKHETNENKAAVILVYLSVVLLGKTFNEVSQNFNLPYQKVRNGVTHLQFQMLHNKNFNTQMKLVFTEFYNENQLKLVA